MKRKFLELAIQDIEKIGIGSTELVLCPAKAQWAPGKGIMFTRDWFNKKYLRNAFFFFEGIRSI
jgi:hypothetical protein